MRGAAVSEAGIVAETELSFVATARGYRAFEDSPTETMEHLSPKQLRSKSDVELMEAFNSGNDYAYGVLYERLHKDVWRFTMKMLRYDEDKASDAFQDIFLRVYEKGETFRGKGTVKSWMMMITRNVCLNVIRSDKRNSPIEEPDEVPAMDFSLAPEHIQEQNSLREIIEQAIDVLPSDLQQVIVLREMEGLSYDEIAEQTNSNLGVVRQRLWRARQKMRKHLLPYLQDDYSYAPDK